MLIPAICRQRALHLSAVHNFHGFLPDAHTYQFTQLPPPSVTMSDSTKSPVPVTAPAASISKFSDREIQILSWAMQSLKSGPPEVRLVTFPIP